MPSADAPELRLVLFPVLFSVPRLGLRVRFARLCVFNMYMARFDPLVVQWLLSISQRLRIDSRSIQPCKHFTDRLLQLN